MCDCNTYCSNRLRKSSFPVVLFSIIGMTGPYDPDEVEKDDTVWQVLKEYRRRVARGTARGDGHGPGRLGRTVFLPSPSSSVFYFPF